MQMGKWRFFERSAEAYAPYAGHIAPGTVLTMDDCYMAVVGLHGAPYELETKQRRNGRAQLINALLRNIADDNVAIYTHLVRRCQTETLPAGEFQSSYARELQDEYGRTILKGLRVNEWFITIIVRPRFAGKRWLNAAKAKLRPAVPRIRENAVQQLEQVTRTVLTSLQDHGAKRLGFRDEGDVRFSEIAEALYRIRTCRHRKIGLVSGSLGASIMTDRPVVEESKRRFKLLLPGETRWGACLGFREYPDRTWPGMLNDLLSADCDLVLTQSFRFMTRAQSLAALSVKTNQLFNAEDKAVSQIEGLEDLKDDTASGRVVVGDHHLVLTVLAGSPSELEVATNRADGVLSNAGANPAIEDRGLEAALLSTLPGTWDWRPRPGAISSWNVAHLSSFENFPAGAAEGYWGKPLIRFASMGGTAFDLVPHVEDVGHTGVYGRTGLGKTALLTFLAAMLEQATGNGKGAGIIFDKDGGAELTVLMTGGRYLKLRRGRPSGMAPLHGLEDTPQNRAFLKQVFTGLIERDGFGGLTPDEERRLARAIARQMQMRPSLRSLTGIREMLGYANDKGAGARFEKYCHGGSMGWLYDNAEDLIRQDAHLLGYDLTELLPSEEGLSDDGAAEAAAAYIIHRARSLMDGRRMWIFCDECRAYLPVLGRILEDMALTGRKKELMLWLAAQEPFHLASHPVGKSLISQCRTTIAFPAANASREGYIDALRFTEPEYEQLTGNMLIGGGRCFLLKREAGSVICRYDLSGIPQHLKVLSARVGTTRLAEQLIERIGNNPAELWPAFQAATADLARPLSTPKKVAAE